LKRLSLSRVSELDLRPAVVARVGDASAEARRRSATEPFPYLLLVDERRRPIGWIADDEIPTEGRLTERMAESMSPLINRRTTLKDALSMLLDADVQAGIVVDRTGAVLGLVTADMIAERMRETAGDARFAQVDLETIEQADVTAIPATRGEPAEPAPS
ncbi:MAG TPA: CBS domain-containing protein, partial [Candidatus Limnocylindrales bacterium]